MGHSPGGPLVVDFLICYAFYLYAQSIKASHRYAFQVKALKIYAPIPKSNIQYNNRHAVNRIFLSQRIESLEQAGGPAGLTSVLASN